MEEPDLIKIFLEPLHRCGFDSYMVSGSVASIEYGEPRATLDLDLAVLLEGSRVECFASAFCEPDYYFPPVDIVFSELARASRGHFNVIHIASGLKADVYPSRNHPLFDWAFQNRRRVLIAGQDVWLAPPEYVILWKLEFFREGAGEKHLRDICGMVAISRNEMDLDFLVEWAKRLGLADPLKKCLR